MNNDETCSNSHGSILAINAGSSSLKFALFAAVPALSVLMRGEISELDYAPHLVAHDGSDRQIADQRWSSRGELVFTEALAAVFALIEPVAGDDGLRAVGHRIVHGGADHVAPERLTSDIIAALQRLIPLDPIHMPHSLAPIAAISKAHPDIAQIACFDTAFHHTMPRVAQQFALPRAISDAGVRRYGFHGLSYEYIASRLASERPERARARIIVAHLGAGASLCAINNGVSVATTFGFSVLDGLMMATRCGSLDPGVIFYLGRMGHSLSEIEDMLYTQSGLLGVSGISSDMRTLLASDDERAREAIELFTYRIAIEIGAMTSALGGVDAIIFTGGIGQHSPKIRTAVCERLAWLGVQLDRAANDQGTCRISGKTSKVEIGVMATDEEAMIARHVLTLIS